MTAGCAWQGACVAEGCAWQGACMAGVCAWQGRHPWQRGSMHDGGRGRVWHTCAAGEMATAADCVLVII